jgi:hypothetical protein
MDAEPFHADEVDPPIVIRANDGTAWTAEEDALLGTAIDAEIVARIGRSAAQAVGGREFKNKLFRGCCARPP